jgi:nicotinamidase-related amidase
MSSSLSLDPKTSALLVMDVQAAVVEMIGIDKEALLARTARLIDAARKAGTKVIYVVVGFRVGYPEVSPRNQSFARHISTQTLAPQRCPVSHCASEEHVQ